MRWSKVLNFVFVSLRTCRQFLCLQESSCSNGLKQSSYCVDSTSVLLKCKLITIKESKVFKIKYEEFELKFLENFYSFRLERR